MSEREPLAVPPKRIPERAPERAPERDEPVESRSMRILLVEDNPAEAELVAESLADARPFRFELAHARTLAEALRTLSERPFDVVLLDLSLPDAQGLETLSRAAAAAPDLPIVVLTGNGDEDVALRSLKVGAQDYLVKGEADGRLLVRSMRYAIERRRVEEKERSLAREQAARAALEKAKVESDRLNRALDETNRAVLALYAELDERAEYLKRASDLKSRFLSNMSHEFRTPLNSILGLTSLLRSGADGPLSAEQEKQIAFIQGAASSLSQMVDDLLDLAKIEAGKATVHVSTFTAYDVFTGLKGMFRAIHKGGAVDLVFDEPEGLPPLHTDESKVSQILRNFVTNALKFTEAGEVRVSARAEDGGLTFEVSDTGLGIAPEDLDRIFDEFVQIEGVHQRHKKGTGLGLPLCRKLARLLGGSVEVESTLGRGSTFRVKVPLRYSGQADAPLAPSKPKLDPHRAPVLIVEDDIDTLFIYERHLRGSGFQVLPAMNLDDARRVLSQVLPTAIVLDILLERESSWEFLSELKRRPETERIPVIVVSVLDGRQHAFSLGAQDFCSKPVERSWLLSRLESFSAKRPIQKVLVIDDDEVARYLVKGFLAGLPYEVIEAAGGREGIEKARSEQPEVIFLDIVMPDLTAFEVLAELKADRATAEIPVIINTSKRLDEPERKRLAATTAAILDKDVPSRQAAVARIQEALRSAGVAASQSASGLKGAGHV